ncbi:MAG: DUF177 domain-containing protein [Anaerolineae bacterium]|nr:DUF177 domain-containing protein [Anaerolineae bacterium]
MKLNVGFLINQQIGTFRDFNFDYPQLTIEDDLIVSNLSGVARLSRTPQGLLVHGSFDVGLASTCVRCLADFTQSLHAEFDELYAFSPNQMTDSGLLVPEDGKIDISMLLHDYLLVEVPISPLCRQDCKGLCAVCGADLNQETCEHQLETVD